MNKIEIEVGENLMKVMFEVIRTGTPNYSPSWLIKDAFNFNIEKIVESFIKYEKKEK